MAWPRGGADAEQLASAHATAVSTAAPHTSRAAAAISRAGREAIMAPQYVSGRAGWLRAGPGGPGDMGPRVRRLPAVRRGGPALQP